MVIINEIDWTKLCAFTQQKPQPYKHKIYKYQNSLIKSLYSPNKFLESY